MCETKRMHTNTEIMAAGDSNINVLSLQLSKHPDGGKQQLHQFSVMGLNFKILSIQSTLLASKGD
jgi:hypothetical protein